MPSTLPEPSRTPQASPRVGVILLNLGTPAAPTAAAVRPYLREFLSDTRVIEIPQLLWQPLLRGVILPFRSKKSAAKYASIWTPQGSPLMVHTENQAKLLQGRLHARLQGKPHRAGPHEDRSTPALEVAFAMRYGQPSVATVIEQLRARGCNRLLCLALYPQYAGSSTGSAYDAVFRHLQRTRYQPAVRTVEAFYDHPAYIQALAGKIRAAWSKQARSQMLVMSFHGVPQLTVDQGDPYQQQCLATGQALAAELGLAAEQYRICFQSRFGPAQWLQPYTDDTLKQLGASGVASVDVVCPGFVSDCLETLEEIADEGQHDFLAAGGQSFRYIPALNEEDAWIDALATLILEHGAGWLTPQV